MIRSDIATRPQRPTPKFLGVNDSSRHGAASEPGADRSDAAADNSNYFARQSVETLAHEIRNPLANINLAANILGSSTLDEESKAYLDIILRNSRRINVLISELLVNKNPESSRKECYSIHNLLDEVLELTKDRIRLKEIKVARNYTPEDSKVNLDVSEMRIALTNIIVNAIEAMEKSKGVLTLSTQRTEQISTLEISDNGCGLNKRDLKHLFKKFFTKKPDGLGLGLSITYSILRLNNVNVCVESNEGKGTRFILSFEKQAD